MRDDFEVKYFQSKDINETKIAIMTDLKYGKLNKRDVQEIIEIFNSKYPDYWDDSTKFEKREKHEWNMDYLKYLQAGVLTDKFSKEYLEFFSDVSHYVYAKGRLFTILIVILFIVLLILVFFLFGN
jgi:hypothetical protein